MRGACTFNLVELGQVRSVNRLISEDSVYGEVLGGLEATFGKPAQIMPAVFFCTLLRRQHTQLSHEEAGDLNNGSRISKQFHLYSMRLDTAVVCVLRRFFSASDTFQWEPYLRGRNSYGLADYESAGICLL